MKSRIAVATTTLLFVAALTFSRLYLGAEFLSTALEGLAFGFAWAALLSIAYLARRAESGRPAGLGAAVAIMFILAGSANIALAHQSDMRRYAMKIQTQTMSISDWWQNGWASLPMRRLSLFGDFDQPLTVQWFGGIAVLKSDLLAHGWRLPAKWTPRSALEFLSPHVHLTALPVLPRLDSGRAEGLVLIRTGPGIPRKDRLVLRLWQSDVLVPAPRGGLAHIWAGTAVDERVERVASLLNIPDEGGNMNAPLDQLLSAIPCSRIVYRRNATASPLWNGAVLLGAKQSLCNLLKLVCGGS